MTLGVCVFKSLTKGYFIKVKYIFTVTHHNDQHSQMNRRGDVCYSNRPIATETYSALFILLWSVCWILSHFVAYLNVLMVHLYLFVVTFSFAIDLFVIFVFVFYISCSFQSVCVCVTFWSFHVPLCQSGVSFWEFCGLCPSHFLTTRGRHTLGCEGSVMA